MTVAEKIKAAFDSQFEAPLSAWNDFVEQGEVVTTKREEILKPSHAIEKYSYFILKGCGGLLLWNRNNFVCTDLYFEGDFFGDYVGFLEQKSSAFEVVTFEPSELFRISRARFEHLAYNTVSGNKICRFSAENLYKAKQTQLINLMTRSASERYADLENKLPGLAQRIPQKYIASYLSITPQSLSRIRNERIRK